MKKSLSIATLTVAGISGALGADLAISTSFIIDNWSKTDTHIYQKTKHVNDTKLDGTNFKLKGHAWGVENYGMNLSVDLSKDTRYEIRLDFSSSGGGYGSTHQPLTNLYLAGSNSSLVYGNYYMNSADVGAARIYTYNTNVSNGSTGHTTGQLNSTYVLNNDWNAGKADWNYKAPAGPKIDVVGGGKLANGFHEYRIVIEAYENSDIADKIALYYTGANGTKWVQSDLSALNIKHDTVFDQIGFFLLDAEGRVEPMTANVFAYTRTEIPQVVEPPVTVPPTITTPPEIALPPTNGPSPSLPEPSAFGLLAGLGALCLVGARRRRR